jgi:hypothetical protein
MNFLINRAMANEVTVTFGGCMSKDLITYGTIAIISLVIVVASLFAVITNNPNANLLSGSIMAVFTFWAGLIVPSPNRETQP